MRKKYLIVFTGIDGSGKTTQAKLLVESLKQKGIQVSYVWARWVPLFLRPVIKKWKRGVTGNISEAQRFDEIENSKRKLLNISIFRWLWFLYFIIDYGLQIFVKIRIGLMRKEVIISDRVFYDSVIDQAINLAEKGDRLLDSLDSFWMKIFFPKPDIVILVDCPVNIAFSRKIDAPNIDYLKKRRELYLLLANRYGWIKVDGALSIDEIAVQIKNKVNKILGI